MLPIPQAGILRRVEGVLAAGKVPYIEEVVIHVREGYELVPLPEGSSYLGFIFARGACLPARGGDAIVEGGERLRFQQLWPVDSAVVQRLSMLPTRDLSAE